MHRIIVPFATCVLLISPSSAYAYIGPGLGLGVFGALIGFIMAIVLGFVGLFWYPIKRLLKKKGSHPDPKIEAQEK